MDNEKGPVCNVADAPERPRILDLIDGRDVP
jgi:hypothetical protein